MRLSAHLYLIGYRGSGKTTVGKLLAKQIGARFVDTDQCIVQHEGQSIREIFDSVGEAGFRDCETAIIRNITLQAPCVVSLGGGAILRESNRELLCESGQCIWLTASAEKLFARIESDENSAGSRPQLTNHTGYDEVVELLSQRNPIYADLAKKTIETDALAPEEIVKEIIDWVNLPT